MFAGPYLAGHVDEPLELLGIVRLQLWLAGHAQSIHRPASVVEPE